MRRIALLGLSSALCGCQFAGNPFDGAGGFLYDTHLFHSNPNLPAGSDETMQRVEGQAVSVEPLTPEPGDIWPGTMLSVPAMQDLQQYGTQPLPPPNVPAAPPPLLFPETPLGPQGSAPPQAPATGNQGAGAVRSGNMPTDGKSVIVPNGDGTSTVIDPDGTIHTIPTPK